MEIVKRDIENKELPEVEPTQEQLLEYCRRSGAPIGPITRLVRRYYRPEESAEVIAKASSKQARKAETRRLNQLKAKQNQYETHPTKV